MELKLPSNSSYLFGNGVVPYPQSPSVGKLLLLLLVINYCIFIHHTNLSAEIK